MDVDVFILCQCINYVDRVDKTTLIICNCQHFLWNKLKHFCHSVVSYFDKGGLNLIFNAHAFVLKKGSVYNCVLRGIHTLHFFSNLYANYSNWSDIKGQLISKCLFSVFTIFQKMKTNRQVVKSNLFVYFLEETSAWKNHFEYVWPLKTSRNKLKKHFVTKSCSNLSLIE